VNDAALQHVVGRMDRLRAAMAARGLPALLISDVINLRWATGFTGSHGYALVTHEDAWLAVDSRYTVQAAEQCPHIRQRHLQSSAAENLAAMIKESGFDVVGIEADRMTVASFHDMEGRLSPALTLRPETDLIREQRLRKDPDELDAIRGACAIVDEVFAYMLGVLRPGMSERDVMLEIEWRMRKHHGAEVAFPTIAVSGPRSAMPHGQPSQRVLEHGDLLTLDFGARWQGYCSDITRTVVLGTPTAEQTTVYQTVLDAQRKAVDTLGPGVTGKQADAVARTHIANAGYGERFGHGLGHSVGLEVHDGPGMSPTSELTLASGMVMTVEPGIYIEDWGGVRIEDDVLITADGPVVLTQAERGLIAL
jgi:Xaa-Pro aminopeptidase